jgi:hypothetical protein
MRKMTWPLVVVVVVVLLIFIGAPTTRDWASGSGAYVELDCNAKEIQLVFASPVSRPVGRFWSKPKSPYCGQCQAMEVMLSCKKV